MEAERGPEPEILYHREVKGSGFSWVHWMTGFLVVAVVVAFTDLKSNRETLYVFVPLLVISMAFSIYVTRHPDGGTRAVTITPEAISIKRFGRTRVIPLNSITTIERDEVPGFAVGYRGGGPGLAAIEEPLCAPELDGILKTLASKHGFELML